MRPTSGHQKTDNTDNGNALASATDWLETTVRNGGYWAPSPPLAGRSVGRAVSRADWSLSWPVSRPASEPASRRAGPGDQVARLGRSLKSPTRMVPIIATEVNLDAFLARSLSISSSLALTLAPAFAVSTRRRAGRAKRPTGGCSCRSLALSKCARIHTAWQMNQLARQRRQPIGRPKHKSCSPKQRETTGGSSKQTNRRMKWNSQIAFFL